LLAEARKESQKAFMKPVSPVIPGVDIDEVVYAADQPEYQPLPAFKCVNGKILTRWELSEDERKLVSEQGYLYLAVSTFNQPLQPVYLSATPPDSIKYVDWHEVPEGVVASRISQPTSENREAAGGRS
jgi:hypothetical protein